MKNLIPQDTLNILQKHQNHIDNMINNACIQEQQNYQNMKKSLENIETYTLEDFKNELVPILNNFNKRLEDLEHNYKVVNNV